MHNTHGWDFTEANYLGKTLSDHNPLEVVLTLGKVPTLIPTWRMQPTLLEDAALRDTLGAATDSYFAKNEGTASTPFVEWGVFKVVIQRVSIATTTGARHIVLQELNCMEPRLGQLESEASHEIRNLQDTSITHAELRALTSHCS
ncbi:hypothetical protein NDU88_000107 [Pleurodeles waltl]|uniref:Endonuclease/exonuclease/phosphatase domain-containing protein n=1 Tax=Pleurodeles waltl TaxID=8319 RepID=A0AAV7U314_PLEWA|nr:hypothetical protein NDU88_000107 [Pleurodeles waltl]